MFQHAPSFCHFRPLRNFVFHFHALCGVASEMKCRSPANLPDAVGLLLSLMILDVKMKATCGMTALERLGGPQWLFASWEMSCIPSEGESPLAADSEMCVGFSLMAFHDPCLSTCFASPGAANGESIGATTVALAVELSGSGVEGAEHLSVQQRFLVAEREGRQCLSAQEKLMRWLAWGST